MIVPTDTVAGRAARHTVACVLIGDLGAPKEGVLHRGNDTLTGTVMIGVVAASELADEPVSSARTEAVRGGSDRRRPDGAEDVGALSLLGYGPPLRIVEIESSSDDVVIGLAAARAAGVGSSFSAHEPQVYLASVGRSGRQDVRFNRLIGIVGD